MLLATANTLRGIPSWVTIRPPVGRGHSPLSASSLDDAQLTTFKRKEATMAKTKESLSLKEMVSAFRADNLELTRFFFAAKP